MLNQSFFFSKLALPLPDPTTLPGALALVEDLEVEEEDLLEVEMDRKENALYDHNPYLHLAVPNHYLHPVPQDPPSEESKASLPSLAAAAPEWCSAAIHAVHVLLLVVAAAEVVVVSEMVVLVGGC